MRRLSWLAPHCRRVGTHEVKVLTGRCARPTVEYGWEMSLASDWRRLRELAWRDRLLLMEAAATIAVASLAIRLLPFRKVVSALARGGDRSISRQSSSEIPRARWAVEACARRLPWRIVCFQQGLALHKLLQRRGIATSLHYGVVQNSDRGLAAHVWVTHEGEAIIGGEQAAAFTCLATFPAAAPR